MALIHTGISLISVDTGTYFHGVYEALQHDEFILTTNKSISLYKASDSKPLQSWMSKPSARFSCPAVFSQESDEIIAVVNQKQIYKWSSDNAAPFKEKPKTLKSAIARIFCLSEKQLLLLMADGSLKWMTFDLHVQEETHAGQLGAGEEIRDAWVWQRGRGGDGAEKEPAHLVCLVHNSQTKEQALHILPLHRGPDSGEDVIRIRLDCPSLEGSPSLVSASLCCCQTSSPTLYTLWNGGHLCRSVITETALQGQKEGEHLVCNQKITVNGTDEKIRIAAIDDKHVAVAGIHSVTEGSKEEGAVSIWETNYGTLQAHQSLHLDEGDDGSIGYLGKVKGHLLAVTSQAVFMHRYECSSGTLASALGRLSDVKQDQGLPVLGLEWTSQEDSDKQTSKEKTASLLKDILDSQKTNTSKKFSSAVEKLLKTSSGSQADSESLSAILRRVVRRVEADSTFWCDKAIKDMISTKVIAASSCPEFLALLARRGEVALLMDCLAHMRDIPELTLVQCLQVFLSIEEVKLQAALHLDESMEEEVPADETMTPARGSLVDLVLCKPFTDNFLLDAVKHLEFKEVLLLLKYLHQRLTTPNHDNPTSQITMDSVVDWIGVLLDAHFTQLVLIPEVRPLLTQLKDAVTQQVAFSTEVTKIRDMLHHTSNIKSQVHSRPQTSQAYSIEVLKI